MIEAKIICDSLAPSGVRLTTFVLTYPRFVHSEFLTHRMFSRNASSSRAIPVKKQIQMVIDNPAMPLAFTKNQKGMQGGEKLDNNTHQIAVAAWLEGRDRAVEIAQRLSDIEVHKQYANRVLEPYAHITVICTATDYTNFFALRCHPDAQPEIHALADQMYGQYFLNKPKQLEEGEWHLPFVNELAPKSTLFSEMGEPKIDENGTSWDVSMGWKLDDDNLIKQSVARCARVSYLNHDGTQTTLEQDLGLYHRLLGGNPIHASPAEHQAMALNDPDFRSGNFRSWVQYRKILSNENIEKFEGFK